MRIIGWLLLLIGLLLCVSIVWAALGFLLMGIGLVALQVAERGRRRAQQAVAATAEGFEMPPEAIAAPTTEPVVRREPVLAPDPEAVRKPDPARSRFDRPAPAYDRPSYDRPSYDRPAYDKPSRDKSSRDKPAADTPAPALTGSPYDKQAWRRLLERDTYLAQVAAVLADYGQTYVDELATRYMAAPDHSRLGTIVDEIIAKAIGHVPVPAADKPPLASPPQPAVARSREIKPTTSPAPAPAAPSSITPPTTTPSPKAPPQKAATEAEDPLAAAIAALASEVAAEPTPPVNPPKPDGERGRTPITDADDDLTEMIRKFAPTSNFLRNS